MCYRDAHDAMTSDTTSEKVQILSMAFNFATIQNIIYEDARGWSFCVCIRITGWAPYLMMDWVLHT